MLKQRFLNVIAGGACFGGLFYGLPIAALHVRLNHLTKVTDGLVTGLFCLFVYGLFAALVCGAAFVGLEILRLLRRRPDMVTVGWGLFWGLLGFNLLFWEAHFLYGRTYEQTPFGTLESLGAMAAFLTGAAVLVAVAVVLFTALVYQLAKALVDGSRLKLVAGALLALGLVVLSLMPLFGAGKEPAAAGAEGSEAAIEVAETGVDVVLVGLDGLDWRVLQPMMDAGRLPAFSEMNEAGARAVLETIPDANSAVIWASMYSGRRPEVHTVHDFYRIEIPGLSTGGLYPVHRSFFQEIAGQLERVGLVRRTLVTRYTHRSVPIWEVLDQAGLTTGVVDGYLTSFPAYAPKVPESYFVAYGSDFFARDLGNRSADDVELFIQPKELFRQIRSNLDGADFEWQSRTLLQLLEEQPRPRFVNLYTHEPDTVSHQKWKWYEPRWYPVVGEDQEKAAAIPEMHEGFDAFLAQLRQEVGPEAVIVVASDHGHVPTFVHKLYTQHRHGPPGVLLMSGGPVRQGFEIPEADVYDLYPTLLYLLGLPVPEDAAGEVLVDALDPAFVEQFPVRTVPSYDHLQGTGTGGGLDDERNRQELEKLKSLGYI